MDRNLDGVFFRMKRDDKWCNVCFSDLTKEEREEVMDGKSKAWLMSLCNTLADTIKNIGDQLDIVAD